jgi:hypothetical protein
MGLPAESDRRWRMIIMGEIPYKPTMLACQILLSHALTSVKNDPSPENVERRIGELRAFYERYPRVAETELRQIFGWEPR